MSLRAGYPCDCEVEQGHGRALARGICPEFGAEMPCGEAAFPAGRKCHHAEGPS